ncbi:MULTISPECIES: TIGR04197 family type VII secretion effector [Staphylococcus]|uniref:Type VII secretion effector n=1 Tax=Staphylococcus agnetis TaxID=985762 RepID=A0A2T4MHH9_9STAP|nr:MULTISPECIES: TIGR04197 family type VII secretion effector [Staphylococcus]ALN77760.1 TIGR04197 family type VII secretion effector [Staphylococcus agnetis]NHM92715.1 TIGR04197 family type VII secretion effector [Staphylococcus sp. 10602379]NJI03750.1 TIGR04197 family type VII secretion effector [Staphylococcus agnetis]NJI13105.1 TIGR04197 family type VII secretion effector [Staphylococcus agnetis]OSP20270.1 type VII secretion effector [Staphylococcus agnetis]
MVEVKLETASTSDLVNNISNSGDKVTFNNVTDTLDNTNITPFIGYAAAIQTLSNAINNYNGIITQDAQAMAETIIDFEQNDQNISSQIYSNTHAQMGLY